MIPPLRSIERATLVVVSLLALMLFVSAPARAIQLRWSTGATDLTVSEDTQAMLVIQADSAEVTLPNTWRLLWTTDSLAVRFTAFDPNSACLVDTAKADSIVPPQTPADSAANLVTAYFCSSGSNNAASAYFLADLPGGGHGKLKVVALDPIDTTQVIESNEATFNGGIGGDYAPVILGASSEHATTELEVSVTGIGLEQVNSLAISAADGLWSRPLTITAHTNTRIAASATVPSALPQATLVLSGPDKRVAADLPADRITVEIPDLPDTVLFRDPNWSASQDSTVFPKDFAFFFNVVPSGAPGHAWKGLFHLIYIRHNKLYESVNQGNGAESLLVHAWSENLRDWRVDKRAFSPNFGNSLSWDQLHVWAPSLMAVGDSVLMFYTGVDASGNQRIGYASTAFLDTSDTQWRRYSNPVYRADNTSWADPVGHGKASWGQQQFRDPFVMPDPQHSGRYLLFNVGEDLNYVAPGESLGYMVVGVARNSAGTFAGWNDLGCYRATDFKHAGATRAEAPLVMRDSSGTGPWWIFFANGDYNKTGSNATYFVADTIGAGVADTTLAYWTGLDSLYFYLGQDPSMLGWEACEHLQIGKAHFFAGYNGDGIAITRTYWDPAGRVFRIGAPETGLVSVDRNHKTTKRGMFLAAYRPGAPDARFVVDTPSPVAPKLAIYDVAGRKIRTLLDGARFEGRRTIVWDLHGSAGTQVPPGVYFARLTGVGAPAVLRVVVVH